MDCSLPGSSVHGIFRARILEWVAISFSRRSSPPRDQTRVSRIVDRHVYRLSHQGSIAKELESISSITYNGEESGKEYTYTCMCAQSLQLCLTFCNTMDCSPPGSSVYGILQSRNLEWVAMPSSRGPPNPGILYPHLLHCRLILYPLSHLGSLYMCVCVCVYIYTYT